MGPCDALDPPQVLELLAQRTLPELVHAHVTDHGLQTALLDDLEPGFPEPRVPAHWAGSSRLVTGKM